MLDWMKRRASIPNGQAGADADAVEPQGRVMCGDYLSLYKYLENRYANIVVLTFAEIEDLLGFTLPDLARLRQGWWTDADSSPARPSHVDSWILASRTARPNLLARTVMFERVS